MDIRFAIPDDVPGILALLRQVGQVHHKGRPDLFREDAQKYSPSQVLGLLQNPATPIFVAVEEGAVLGYVFCQERISQKDTVLKDNRILHLEDFCVDEGIRGKGVGSALFAAVDQYAKTKNYHSITLNVWCFKGGAKAFYEKLGFTERNICMERRISDA